MNSFQAQMHKLSTYHILNLDSFSVLLILPITLSILQVFIIIKLIITSVGEKIANNKVIILSIILAMLVDITRIFIGVPFHIFVNTFITAIIITVTTKIGILKSLIGTIFAQTTVIAGSIIIIEPMFIWCNENILHYAFTTAIGYSIGVLLETIIPAIILFILIKYNIVLFGRARKGKDLANERSGQ